MLIRPLDPLSDRALVDALLASAADYYTLERGAPPGPEVTEEFFADAPPGIDPATSLRLGLFGDSGAMLALAEMAFGYPEARDSYLGLMIVAPDVRGKGTGAHFLRHLEGAARTRGALRMLLAVLEANPRGRSFWEREGFGPVYSRTVNMGARTHLAHCLGKSL